LWEVFITSVNGYDEMEIYKKSVINMGTKVYNNLPKYLKEKMTIKPLRKS
jgi:hypothetical protein